MRPAKAPTTVFISGPRSKRFSRRLKWARHCTGVPPSDKDEETREKPMERARSGESLGWRAIVAAGFGIAASLTPWPRPPVPPPGSAWIELLAPRGEVGAPPTAVIWRAAFGGSGENDGVESARLIVRDRAGTIVASRTTPARSRRRIVLSPEERAVIGRVGSVSLELWALSADGELIGVSEPAFTTLQR